MNKAVLERYRKMLALASDDPKSPESQTAFKMAGEFAAKHGLSEADLDVEGHLTDDMIEEVKLDIWDRNTMYWDSQLALAICEAFDCAVCRTANTNNPNAYKAYKILGGKTDVSLATWYWKFLKIRIARQAEVEYHLVRDQKECAMGIVYAVGIRLKEMYEAKEEMMTPDTKALVVVKKADLEKAKKEHWPRLSGGVSFQNNQATPGAFRKGMKIGENMGLSQPIAAGNNNQRELSPTGAALIGKD